MGRLAYVLGSGRSAKGLDFARLKQRAQLWGLNESAFHAPCDRLVTIDRCWAEEEQERIRDWGAAHVAPSVHAVVGPSPKWPGFSRMEWERVHGMPSNAPGECSVGWPGGGSTGLAVLNVLAQLDYKKIILFGYDLHEGDYGYWYSDYVHPHPYVPGVIAGFKEHARWYECRGIEILNANPQSALTCFKRISHEDAYNA